MEFRFDVERASPTVVDLVTATDGEALDGDDVIVLRCHAGAATSGRAVCQGVTSRT